MTTPAYIANPKQPPHHRGNTYATGCDRPWYPPMKDQRRVGQLDALYGSLCAARSIAGGLGTATDDYETSIRCLLDRVSAEKCAILDGCSG